ncbi:hypothetical protein I4U23_004388 [Adineta vaga]|nr:hypothetical protein I4U23_004388 [Adineta vaga]
MSILCTTYLQHLSWKSSLFAEKNLSSIINNTFNDDRNHQISVIIINWLRPNNVKIILQTLVNFDKVGDIVVIMANPSSTFTYSHPKVRLIVNYSISDEWGVAVRFHACAYEAWHHRVLLLDDDLLLSYPDIRRFMAVQVNKAQPVCFQHFGRTDGSRNKNRTSTNNQILSV